jgi:precorrin-2 dehydrogenase/sirohydrochlorin ferrochelatase
MTMTDRYYPIFVDLAGRTVVVVGGGEVALRKVESLAAAGARVRVVAPEIDARIHVIANAECRQEPYTAAALEGATLAIAATDRPEVNSQVSADCRQRGLLCNVVDVPAECDFIVPSVMQQGPLVIAVSTGGAAPSAAGRIRRRIEREFGPAYGLWLARLGRLRADLKGRVADDALRRELFLRLSADDVLAAAEAGAAALDEKVRDILAALGLEDTRDA